MFGYINKNETLMENGFNVAFDGVIYLKLSDIHGLNIGTVENKGDGGCNTYYWDKPHFGVKFREEAIATLGERFEVEDLYIEYLHEKSLGLVPTID